MDRLDKLRNQLECWADSLDPLVSAERRSLLAGTLAEILRADECAVMAPGQAGGGDGLVSLMDRPADHRILTAVGYIDAIPYIVIRAIRSSEPFAGSDACLLELAAHCLAKGVEVARLRAALRSRFTQIAALAKSGGAAGKASKMIVEHPDKMARLVARSFYREMSRAGFECNQIIDAAGEIVSELSKNLRRRRAEVGGKHVPDPELEES